MFSCCCCVVLLAAVCFCCKPLLRDATVHEGMCVFAAERGSSRQSNDSSKDFSDELALLQASWEVHAWSFPPWQWMHEGMCSRARSMTAARIFQMSSRFGQRAGQRGLHACCFPPWQSMHGGTCACKFIPCHDACLQLSPGHEGMNFCSIRSCLWLMLAGGSRASEAIVGCCSQGNIMRGRLLLAAARSWNRASTLCSSSPPFRPQASQHSLALPLLPAL